MALLAQMNHNAATLEKHLNLKKQSGRRGHEKVPYAEICFQHPAQRLTVRSEQCYFTT